MDRRIFLRNVFATGVATSGLVAAQVAAKSRQVGEQAKTLGKDVQTRLSERMESLETRMDKLDHRHKNLIRVGAVCFAVSTGVDLTVLL